MKQLILFTLLLLFLAACDKDPSPPLAPAITTGNASNVENSTATVSLSITDVSKTKEMGVLYSRSSSGLTSINAQKGSIKNFISGDNSVSLTGLLPGTTYYYMAFTSDGYGFIYGAINNFKTGIDYPILTTNSASNIKRTQATCGGNITSSGGGSITARGICWSTSINPTISLSTKTVDDKGTGSFSSTIAGLQPEITYYVRAYATNEKGTAYGVQVIFTTLPISIPTITTASVSSITTTTATGGGTITDNGGATVTERGVCWSTSSNPTISNNKTSNGTGSGSFISSINGLAAGTTYYVRAYATNQKGTAYSTEVYFATNGIVTDIDGNVYNTITIGTQVWMVENMKTTKYNDGTLIPLVIDNDTWLSLTSAAYCWYNNAYVNKNTYGALYNWYAVITGKLAPKGWHVPSDAEWTILTSYLGGESIAGGKLKEKGTSLWTIPNTSATNETGFSAIPAGYRNYDFVGYGGKFYDVGFRGYWWSYTEANFSDTAKGRALRYNGSDMSNGGYYKRDGLSVRCIRDY